MNVASLELCKELYELSGWEDISTGAQYWLEFKGQEAALFGFKFAYEFDDGIPAYDLGYLLRKLPPRIVLSQRTGKTWDADCYCGQVNGVRVKDTSVYAHANTPENATAKLCIELIKQGILK